MNCYAMLQKLTVCTCLIAFISGCSRQEQPEADKTMSLPPPSITGEIHSEAVAAAEAEIFESKIVTGVVKGAVEAVAVPQADEVKAPEELTVEAVVEVTEVAVEPTEAADEGKAEGGVPEAVGSEISAEAEVVKEEAEVAMKPQPAGTVTGTVEAASVPRTDEVQTIGVAEEASVEAAEASAKVAEEAVDETEDADEGKAEEVVPEAVEAEIAAEDEVVKEKLPGSDSKNEEAPGAETEEVEAGKAAVEPVATEEKPAKTGSILQPTRIVRVRIESSQPEDYFLAAAAKHLYIGSRDLRVLPGREIDLSFDEVGEEPLTLRIQHYELTEPVLKATAFSPEGVSEVVFAATPHPATVQLFTEPERSEIWQVAGDGSLRFVGGAAKPLWISPLQELYFEVRAPGLRPCPVTIAAADPAAVLPDVRVRCLTLPLTALPGQACRIVLRGSCDLELAWVPGGEIVLRDPRLDSVPPDVRVDYIPRGYWLAKTQTTRAQWRAVMGREAIVPAHDDLLPQTEVTWEDSLSFCDRLNQFLYFGTARLPTEAEWQHAANAGTGDPFGGVSSEAIVCTANSGGKVASLKSGRPNLWNLYHLSGNVREWCADEYAVYRAQGRAGGSQRRVVRGGGFRSSPGDCQIAVRDAELPGKAADDLGFRIVIQPVPIAGVAPDKAR